jgi:hypothetical protein
MYIYIWHAKVTKTPINILYFGYLWQEKRNRNRAKQTETKRDETKFKRNEYWIRDHLYGTMLIEGLCCLMRFFKEEKQQQKSKPEAYLIADMFHVYTIENLCFLGWNLTNKSSSAPRLCSVFSFVLRLNNIYFMKFQHILNVKRHNRTTQKN